MDFVHYHVPTYRDNHGTEAHSKLPGLINQLDDSSPSSSSSSSSSQSQRASHMAGDPPSNTAPTREPSGDDAPEAVEENDENGIGTTRPRLTREQVWLLEQEFLAHYKPNTNIKRQLAETTGLSLPRVANWFQNRRAKAKQQRRQDEREMVQALDAAGRLRLHQPPSPDTFGLNDFSHFAGLDPSSRQAGLPSYPGFDMAGLGTSDPCVHQVQYESPAEASYASLSRSIAAATAAVAQGAYQEMPFSASGAMDGETVVETARFPANGHLAQIGDSPAIKTGMAEWVEVSQPSSVYWDTPSHQLGNPFESTISSRQLSQLQEPSEEIHEVQANFSDAMEANNFRNPFTIPVFPSQLARIQQMQQDSQQARLQEQQLQQQQIQADLQSQHPNRQLCAPFHNDPQTIADQIGASSTPGSPEAHDHSLNIAARRKRPRPAALGGAALRSSSHMSGLSSSPTAKGSLLGPMQSVRRIRSTGNNLNLQRGRIQKINTVSAQRSPLNFETFADAGAFREAMSSSGSESISINGSLAPPTPMSPVDMGRFYREPGPMSCSASQDSGFVYAPDYPGCFVPNPLELSSRLVSPPTTPQYGAALQQAFLKQQQQQQHVHEQRAQQAQSRPQRQRQPQSLDGIDIPGPFGGFLHFSNGTSNSSHADEALISPQISSFPSQQLHMPQPVYVSPISCGDAEMAGALESANDLQLQSSSFQSSSFKAYMQQRQWQRQRQGEKAQPKPQPQQQQQQPKATIVDRLPDPPASAPSTKTTFIPEFFFHEPTPQQQQQQQRSSMSSKQQQQQQQQKPRNYVFANRTPDDFD